MKKVRCKTIEVCRELELPLRLLAGASRASCKERQIPQQMQHGRKPHLACHWTRRNVKQEAKAGVSKEIWIRSGSSGFEGAEMMLQFAVDRFVFVLSDVFIFLHSHFSTSRRRLPLFCLHCHVFVS